MTHVIFPANLSKLAGHQCEHVFSGETMQDLIALIIAKFPAFQSYLLDQQGHLSTFINFYLNGLDIRSLQREKTPVAPNDIIHIVTAISGG